MQTELRRNDRVQLHCHVAGLDGSCGTLIGRQDDTFNGKARQRWLVDIDNVGDQVVKPEHLSRSSERDTMVLECGALLVETDIENPNKKKYPGCKDAKILDPGSRSRDGPAFEAPL